MTDDDRGTQPEDAPRSDRCLGCDARNPPFTDIRTGHRYCHECVTVLVSWENDYCPPVSDEMEAWLPAELRPEPWEAEHG